LESGLKLDINRLVKAGFIPPLGSIATLRWSWSDGYTGQRVATATLRVERLTDRLGECGIEINGRWQLVWLEASPRHYGGVQWYFICPVTKRRVSVLWMPPGARTFACRQAWGRQVAYVSQFCDRDNRAHRGKVRINARLCRIGGFNPEEWDFPPKPKGMRWRTYQRLEEQFERYEAILDEGIEELAARLGWLK
jgi:hypothetical protein